MTGKHRIYLAILASWRASGLKVENQPLAKPQSTQRKSFGGFAAFPFRIVTLVLADWAGELRACPFSVSAE